MGWSNSPNAKTALPVINLLIVRHSLCTDLHFLGCALRRKQNEGITQRKIHFRKVLKCCMASTERCTSYALRKSGRHSEIPACAASNSGTSLPFRSLTPRWWPGAGQKAPYGSCAGPALILPPTPLSKWLSAWVTTGHKTLEMVPKYRAQRNQRAASKCAQQKRER